MKRIAVGVAMTVLAATELSAQINVGGDPYSFRHGMAPSSVPSIRAASFDRASADALDQQRAQRGDYPADARLLEVNADPDNSGVWTELPNGDGLWRVRVVSEGALATELYFSDFSLPAGGIMHIYDDNGDQLIGGFTSFNSKPHGRFATAIIQGEASIVEYYEPAEVRGTGYFRISQVGHTYRRLGGENRAGDCEVDVNCSEGDGWEDQRDGVVRIRMVENGQIAGYCSGSLVNNVTLDCKPYFLTAHHCGPTVSADDLLLWKFYFKYERTGCGVGSASTSKVMTGAVKRGESNDNGGATGSDFLLVEGDDPVPNSYSPFWLGWDATTNTHVGGKCIHHPNGDEKKISTFTGTAQNSTQWNTHNTHYRVFWVETDNGWGVTEGGSSGSPLFESTGKIIGTLTGGTSYCNSEMPGGQDDPDWFGRMNYHWTSNGGPSSEDLKNWLDPNNTGTLVLEGSYGPCGTLGSQELDPIAELAVFPNPVADHLRVDFPSDLDYAERVEMLDIAGRVVISSTAFVQGYADISVQGLAMGPYMVRVIADGRVVGTAKVDVMPR